MKTTALPLLIGLLITCSANAGEISKKPLRLTQGGTPEKPAVFDGKGMNIDLGVDVTDHAWKKEGDVWTSSEPLSGPQAFATGQSTALFLDELPIIIARVKPAEKDGRHPLKPGQMACTEDGRIYFRWPPSKSPGQARIILPPKSNVSCVTIACSHIIVRNITAIHAGNDGFNIHGKWVGIRLENVKAFSNADEGISAHDDVQMDVVGAEIAWNGSSAGGVADVNRCTTTYKDCQVHDNVGAAFKFTGKSHSVSDTLIYNQARDFDVAAGTEFKKERVEWRQSSDSETTGSK